jgi:hypothetical protein
MPMMDVVCVRMPMRNRLMTVRVSVRHGRKLFGRVIVLMVLVVLVGMCMLECRV